MYGYLLKIMFKKKVHSKHCMRKVTWLPVIVSSVVSEASIAAPHFPHDLKISSKHDS